MICERVTVWILKSFVLCSGLGCRHHEFKIEWNGIDKWLRSYRSLCRKHVVHRNGTERTVQQESFSFCSLRVGVWVVQCTVTRRNISKCVWFDMGENYNIQIMGILFIMNYRLFRWMIVEAVHHKKKQRKSTPQIIKWIIKDARWYTVQSFGNRWEQVCAKFLMSCSVTTAACNINIHFMWLITFHFGFHMS